jgi:hypothetical protein
MLSDFLNIKYVIFGEHPITDIGYCEPGKYDISSNGLDIPVNFIIDNEFSIPHYSIALANKLCSLPHSELAGFLDYHCSLVKDPITWLNNVEKLLSENYDIFEHVGGKSRIPKLYALFQDRRNKVSACFPSPCSGLSILAEPNVRFDFNPVKAYSDSLGSYEEKAAFLIETRATYKQIMKKEMPFESQIDIELEKLDKIESLNLTDKHTLSGKSKKVPKGKIQINCRLNVFVDVFYQLMHDFEIDGLPLINCPSSTLAYFIENFCVNREGKKFSKTSVDTILNPSREEKRPKVGKRIDLKNIIQSDEITNN